MMFRFLKENEYSSEDSDSETSYISEEDSHSDASSVSFEEVGNTFDSVLQASKKNYQSCYKITLNNVREIEEALDFSEFISIIFLLFDPRFALQEIFLIIQAGPGNFSRDKLTKWALTSPANWNYMLLEALAIIQNCSVLMKLGFCINDINAMRDAPQCISRIKKVLFSSVCDYLKRDQARDLIDNVRHEVKFDNDITLNCDPKYIEFHVLFWVSRGYINLEREPYLDKLAKHMKVIEYEMYLKINEEMPLWTNTTCSKSDQAESHDEDDCYKIRDPFNPGLVIIINNAKFEKNIEMRKEFQVSFLNYYNKLNCKSDV